MGREIDESVMQAIASEMNLSETAFVSSANDDYKKQERFGLRWFTPTNEVRTITEPRKCWFLIALLGRI